MANEEREARVVQTDEPRGETTWYGAESLQRETNDAAAWQTAVPERCLGVLGSR